jgi:fumarate reductase flavoprotein subunit
LEVNNDKQEKQKGQDNNSCLKEKAMKNPIRILSFGAILCFALFFGCSSQNSAASGGTEFKAGVYSSAVQGHNGEIKVSVTFSGNAIVAVNIDKHEETVGLGETALKSLSEQVVKTNSLAVDVITGATVSSRALLRAIENCVTEAGGSVAALKNAASGQQKAVDVDTDIVVVGGGAAGLSAAINIRYLGKKVILLEKLSLLGGNTILGTTGIGGVGSKLFKEQGLTATTEAFYNSTNPTGPGKIPEALWVMADKSGEALDWINDLGAGLTRTFNTFFAGTNDGTGLGLHIVPALQAEAEKTGVDIRLNNRAVEIVMVNGKAAGVKVQSPSGNYTINAKAVILCAGGFANNPEMVTKYDPRWVGFGCSSSVGQTGDGILMAQAIGADLWNMDVIVVNPSVAYLPDQRLSLTTLRRMGGIMVNKEGERFANEYGNYTEAAEAITKQTDKLAYMVFDTEMLNLGIIKGYYDRGLFTEAPTIAELAAKMGIDPTGLEATVETYKTYFANRKDPEFGNTIFNIDFTKPPYMGIEIFPAVQGTNGGVKVDVDTHVIDTQGKIIPHLYAAGENAGEGTQGEGSTLTIAIVFGKIAAQKAVAEMP